MLPSTGERMLKSAADVSRGVVGSVSSGSKKAWDAAASGSRGAREEAARGSQRALDSTAAVSREAWKSASVSAAGLLSVTQGALAKWIPVNKEGRLKSAADVSRGVAASVSIGSKKAWDSAASGSRGALESAASGSRRALDSATAVSREAWESASVSAAGLLSVTQGVLASRISADLDSMLASLAKGPATIYDKAMDAGYLVTHIGGGNHRLFDGGHTIAGAFQAVRGASTEESIIQEGLGFVQGMFRDLTTSKGLPLANWDKATYDQVAGFMESRFYVGRDWFYDLNSYTSAELVGGSIGILAVVFQWNRADTESFSRMVGSMGMAAVISANPLLLVIMVVAFARAFEKARMDSQYGDLVDGSGRCCMKTRCG